MNKQVVSIEDEQKQIDLLSFILVVMVVVILPLIAIPKIVSTPINTVESLDIHGYSKLVFLIILSMIMVTLMGFKALARKQHIKISLPLALFLLWVLVSLFFADDVAIAFHGYPMRWQGFVAYFCYIVVFTFVVNMINKKYIAKILAAFFIGVGICAIHSLLNYCGFEPLNIITKTFYDATIIPGISRAALGNRNTAGAFFAVPTIILLVLFVSNRGRRNDILYYIALVLSFTGLMVSLTRIAWLGTIGAMVLVVWYFRKDFKVHLKKFVLVAITFITVIILLDVSGNGQIVGRYYSMKEQINKAVEGDIEQFGSSRFYVYGKAFKVIAAHPIVGTGPDCFAYYAIVDEEELKKYPELGETGYFDKVHSEYLEYAATMGIPAFIFYLWFLLSIFVPWIKRSKEMKPEILAILLGLTAYLIQACFNFGAISTLPVFFVLLGILKNVLVNENNNADDWEVGKANVDSTIVDNDDKNSLT